MVVRRAGIDEHQLLPGRDTGPGLGAGESDELGRANDGPDVGDTTVVDLIRHPHVTGLSHIERRGVAGDGDEGGAIHQIAGVRAHGIEDGLRRGRARHGDREDRHQ